MKNQPIIDRQIFEIDRFPVASFWDPVPCATAARSGNHQLIVNRFSGIVNPPAPESSEIRPTFRRNRQIGPLESTDYLPISSGYVSSRSLQPLASVAALRAHFNFSAFQISALPPVNYPKRLIEVDLPIKRISAHARREKSIRHGHIRSHAPRSTHCLAQHAPPAWHGSRHALARVLARVKPRFRTMFTGLGTVARVTGGMGREYPKSQIADFRSQHPGPALGNLRVSDPLRFRVESPARGLPPGITTWAECRGPGARLRPGCWAS